ncbi:putative toxin-antitoxin system toxin component, PIN family [Variovorax sp.]|uniref:putative toxin-antitoxin system toxin component, PIN family n=1 Tax=Variovorax sp. TaxID=1871043 RepID=UPI000C35A3ED|nr:putative toxin-antitoxin system toxin component, PIN family [Variovorax sp.]MBS74920.1 putative toxin-antitoxin system toxin component, PIN family [Variovorax sp.]
MRILLDTNLLISAVISAGLPRQLLDGALAGDFELCTSEILLAELLGVLERPKFAERLARANVNPRHLVENLRGLSVVVVPAKVPRVVPTDPDDDHVVAAAVAGAVDLIVSGDRRDLLPLGSHAGIPIVDAREAVERLAQRGSPPR